MSKLREVKESPLYQGEDEQISYKLTTTPWGSSPSNVSVAIYDSDHGDVSSDCLATDSASVSGDEITTPLVSSVQRGKYYTLEIKFTSGGNVFESYLVIKGEY